MSTESRRAVPVTRCKPRRRRGGARAALAIALLLAVACALAYFGARRGGPASSAALSRDAAEHTAQPERHDGELDGAAAEPGAVRVPEFDPRRAPGALEGSLVLVDDRGREWAGLDGALELGGGGELLVRAGRFRLELAPGEAPRIRRARLAGRGARIEAGSDPIADRGERSIALRARWLSRLHVVDALDATPLRCESVVALDAEARGGAPMRSTAAPEERLLARDLLSPIELDAPAHGSGADELVVRVPGYAPGRVRLDRASGGEWVLALERGGELALTLSGPSAEPGCHLRLERLDGDGEPCVELLLDARRQISIADLRAGAYRVAIEVGPWWDDPFVVAAGVAEVRPGERAELELELAQSSAPPTAPLAGSLVVPDGWSFDPRGSEEAELVSLELLDPPRGAQEAALVRCSVERARESAGTWRWSAGRIQAGRYELRVEALGYTCLVDHDAPGRDDLRVELPPPVRVELELADARTSAPLEVEHLAWRVARADDVTGRHWREIERGSQPGRCAFRAPRGEIELAASSGADAFPAYAPVHRIVRVGPEATRIALAMERACVVRLRLTHRGRSVAWDGLDRPEPEPLSGSGRTLSADVDALGLRFVLSAPGSYRFAPPRCAVLGSAAPVVAVAREDEQVLVEVELAPPQPTR